MLFEVKLIKISQENILQKREIDIVDWTAKGI